MNTEVLEVSGSITRTLRHVSARRASTRGVRKLRLGVRLGAEDWRARSLVAGDEQQARYVEG
jgi:hypothetical protein